MTNQPCGRKPVNAEIRFWAKVFKSKSKCWLWLAGKDKDGYGRFSEHQTPIRAHRFSWKLYFGKIPAGKLVCHHCDNPSCVNPRHLFVGTTVDNARDKVGKGRQSRGQKHAATLAKVFGEQHPKSKITWKTARLIRKLRAQGMTYDGIADRLGMGKSSVYYVIKKGWLE